jgi:hypothetical protein
MSVLFKENIKQRKIMIAGCIALFVAIIIAIASRGGSIQHYGFAFLGLLVMTLVVNFIVDINDRRSLDYILSLLYHECDPERFIETIESRVDALKIQPQMAKTLELHKANALCYEGKEQEAIAILQKYQKTTTIDSEKVLFAGNIISYKILNNDLEGLEEEIETYRNFIAQVYEGVKGKDREYHENNFMQKNIEFKIATGKEITEDELHFIWEKVEREFGNEINKENLRLYAALYLRNIGDISGAIEQIGFIRTESGNTITQRRALSLLQSLQDQKKNTSSQSKGMQKKKK